MKTVVSLASNSLERVASLAAERLEAGGLVALPTDTVYGLACLVQHGEAVDRLYEVKGRHSSKPIAICVAEAEEVQRWAELTVEPELVADLLPGPVHIVTAQN